MAAVLTAMSACTTTKRVYVPIESVSSRSDTLYKVLTHTDTVRERDSVTLVVRGDTVYLTRWQFREKVRERHDTIYRTLTDTVHVERAVPMPVERTRTFWERVEDKLVLPFVAVIFALVGIVVIRWIRKEKG